ncbi:FAD-dependent monooxygenase [Nocardia sp. NPDC004415]
MSACNHEADVLIVGAGPVGLLLAGDLAQGGAEVIVFEQLSTPTTESRASTLHTRTMELLAERGILSRLGELAPGGPGHFGGILLDLAEADPGHPYAGQWKCAQARLEAVLQERAVHAGATVLRGTRVVTVDEEGDRVAAGTIDGTGVRARHTAAYLVGCDGEQSTVRDLAGFEFAGSAATEQMLRADIAGVTVAPRRFERSARGLATAARWPDGSTRVMVHVHGAAPTERSDPGFATVAAAWAEVTREDISGARPLWTNRFDNTSRQVTQYRRGRVLLAGDAAHQQMPVGGQSLNLGLQDAAALSGRLLAVLEDSREDEQLDAYHAERHAIGARTLTNIRAQSTLLLGDARVDAVRELFGELMVFDVVRAHLARMICAIPGTGAESTTTEGNSDGQPDS